MGEKKTALERLLEEAGQSKGDSLKVKRYDLATLNSPVRTPEGFLKADAFLTRAGIFEYHTTDGVIRELRPAQNVFDAASIESLKMKPVTDDHPEEGGQRVLLTPDNTAKFNKGHIGENIQIIGDRVNAKVMITDKDLIERIEGGRNQLSCGYTCDLKFEGGVFDGKKYDAVQSNIVYNHVSVVGKGRAGPDVAMRIDSAEGETIEVKTPIPQEDKYGNRIILLKPFLYNHT